MYAHIRSQREAPGVRARAAAQGGRMNTLRNLPLMFWAMVDAACLAYLAGVIVGVMS